MVLAATVAIVGLADAACEGVSENVGEPKVDDMDRGGGEK